MTNPIIQIKNLSFAIGDFQILNSINLNINEGNIYGFLGPNGAGKSTTIRILLNLYRVPYENLEIFGMTYEKHRIDILKNIGALIEQPSLYSHLTGEENLEVTRRLLDVPFKRVSEVLEIVGLTQDKNRKVKQYSMGMKQRLAIGLSLLNKSKLLILDEPTNGLDPKGISEIRELLLKLNKDFNYTIFISSHILSEIERLVTDIAVINKGEIIFSGSIESFKAKDKGSYILELNKIELAMILLKKFSPERINNNKLLVNISNIKTIANINRQLITNGIELYECYGKRKTLEELFLEVTDGEE